MDIHTPLMFEGRAGEAVNFYVSHFPNSRIVDVQRHGEEGPGKPGISTLDRFELNCVEYRALDSARHHAFSFTPSMSLFVGCDGEAELDRLYAALAEGGAGAHAGRQLRLQPDVRLGEGSLRRVVAAQPGLRPLACCDQFRISAMSRPSPCDMAVNRFHASIVASVPVSR